MNENNKQDVKTSDILKHYFSSLLIYGIILLFLVFSPVYMETVNHPWMNYATVFAIYYLFYLIFAPAVFFIIKPQSILNSRNFTMFNYIKRQFKKNNSTEEFLQNIEPKEDEKQAFMILFMKTFFGVNCVNLLCNTYLPSMDYNFDFLKVMFDQAVSFGENGAGFFQGFAQYIIDTGDMWLKLILTVSTIVLTISYLTELDLFKNKIKSIDTTPLGVISCIICYYPLTILTGKFLQLTQTDLLPVENQLLLVTLNLIVIGAHLFALLAILRLGTRAGNLTNRGIVTGFPYNIIRHPDYSMQIIYIIITSLTIYQIPDYNMIEKIFLTFAILGWIYIYYLRAITEERHLIKDPKYQEYVQKVKYRFIPKVF